MTRSRIVLALCTAGLGLAVLAGCDRLPGADPSAASATLADVPAEAQALATMGFDTGTQGLQPADVAPSTGPSAGSSAGVKQGKRARRPLRRFLRRNTEHGEFVVNGKQGAKTVDVQRGTVTAINDQTVTVRSADGFTATWTFGSPIRVLEKRTTVQPSAVQAGALVGIAGTRDGGTTTAKLIVIG